MVKAFANESVHHHLIRGLVIFIRVSFQMSFQRGFRRESFPTVRATQIRLVVTPHVPVVLAPNVERFLTRFARIHARPVNFLMLSKREFRIERFRTLRTLETFPVALVVTQSNVTFHERHGHESLVAVRTSERFLTQVIAHVKEEGSALSESLAAHFTNERFDFQMYFLMEPEYFRRDE